MTTTPKKRQSEALTADEIIVLQCVAVSHGPYRDIARDLGISTSSVNSALYKISRKIGVRRRHGLTVWAFQAGIVDVHTIKLEVL